MNTVDRRTPESEWIATPGLVQRILDAVGQAAAVIAPTGQLVAANSKLAELLGEDRERLVGRTTEDPVWRVRDSTGRPFAEPLAAPRRFFERSRSAISGVVDVTRSDGSSTSVAARAIPVFGEADLLEGLLVLLDPPELDPDRIAIERRRMRLGFIADVLDAVDQIRDSGRLQDIAERLSGRIGELIAVRAVTEDQRLAIVAAAASTPALGQLVESVRAMPPVAVDEGLSGRALSSGRPAVTTATGDFGGALLSSWRSAMAGCGLAWLAAIPLRGGGQPVGALIIGRVDIVDTFSLEELGELQPLADWIGHAMEDAGRAEAAGRTESSLQALVSLIRAAAGSAHPRLLMDIATQQLVSTAGADAAAIHLLHSSDGMLMYAAGAGFRDLKFRPGGQQDSIYLDRAAAGESVHLEDLREASHWDRPKLAGIEGLVGYDAVPIRWGDVCYGVLEVFSRKPGGFQEPPGLLAGIASTLGGAIRLDRLSGSMPRVEAGTTLIRGGSRLSPTELDIVRLVALGLSNVEIGRRVYLSRETIKYHLHRLYRRLGVNNRAELVAIGTRRGWV
jgi:DNA-binding CsgD family transcriptional regulator/GAF domain-containing protein